MRGSGWFLWMGLGLCFATPAQDVTLRDSTELAEVRDKGSLGQIAKTRGYISRKMC